MPTGRTSVAYDPALYDEYGNYIGPPQAPVPPPDQEQAVPVQPVDEFTAYAADPAIAANAAPVPVPSELYGGPAPPPVYPSSNDPNAMQTYYPASGASPTVDVYRKPVPVPASTSEAAYSDPNYLGYQVADTLPPEPEPGRGSSFNMVTAAQAVSPSGPPPVRSTYNMVDAARSISPERNDRVAPPASTTPSAPALNTYDVSDSFVPAVGGSPGMGTGGSSPSTVRGEPLDPVQVQARRDAAATAVPAALSLTNYPVAQPTGARDVTTILAQRAALGRLHAQQTAAAAAAYGAINAAPYQRPGDEIAARLRRAELNTLPPQEVPARYRVAPPEPTVIDELLGNAIPFPLDAFGRQYGWGTRLGDAARAAQDVVGGVILGDQSKPTTPAGRGGREAGRTIDAAIDSSAEALRDAARAVVLASAGVMPAPPVAPAGGTWTPTVTMRPPRQVTTWTPTDTSRPPATRAGMAGTSGLRDLLADLGLGTPTLDFLPSLIQALQAASNSAPTSDSSERPVTLGDTYLSAGVVPPAGKPAIYATLPEGMTTAKGRSGVTYVFRQGAPSDQASGMVDEHGRYVIFPENISKEDAAALEFSIRERVLGGGTAGSGDGTGPQGARATQAIAPTGGEGAASPTPTVTSPPGSTTARNSGGVTIPGGTGNGAPSLPRAAPSGGGTDDAGPDFTADDFLRDFNRNGEIDDADRARARQMAMAANRRKRAGKRGSRQGTTVPSFPRSPLREQILAAIGEAIPTVARRSKG